MKLGGVHVHCLLDSGSQVSTITESFFTNHFRPRRSKLLDINQWVTLTAANGLEIPYIGYLELDFEAQGVTIPNRGVLVVRDPPDPQSRARKEAVPGLIGMNIIQRKNQEIKEPKLLEDSAWTNTLQAAGKAMTSVRGFAKIAGKSDVRIPAGMVTTVDATGYRGSQPGEDHPRRPRGSRVDKMFVVKVYCKIETSPWALTLTEPVPEAFELPASDWPEKIFSGQSAKRSCRVTLVFSYTT